MKRIIASLLLLSGSIALGAQDRIALLHGPYLQNVGATEATIVWVSSETSVGWVEIAPDDGNHFYATARPAYFDCRNGIKTESRIHKVRITGLEPATTYRYRVFSTQILEHSGNYVNYGRTASTKVYKKEPLRLTTLDPDKEEVTFAMVNDIHGDADKMARLLGLCDMDKTDMVLFVGDMVSIFNSEEKVFSGFMDKATEMFASEKPMFYTRGNHETRGELAYHFQDYFSPMQEHIYYMYRLGPVCFIALDSGEDKPDSDIEYSGINLYDRYRDEQAEWLEKVVESEEFKSAPFRIVTCHIPPVGSWHGAVEVGKKFIPILEKAGVDLMLCGHTHKYMRKDAGEKASFPIVVNSNADVLQCTVNASGISVRIVGPDGRLVDSMDIRK